MTDEPQKEMFSAAVTPAAPTATTDIATRLEQILAKAAEAEFDWSADESVILQEQLAVAVYRNPRNAIVIRQEGVGDEDDRCVVLRDGPAARILIDALLRELGEDPR